jgi:serine/threonine protein kinase
MPVAQAPPRDADAPAVRSAGVARAVAMAGVGGLANAPVGTARIRLAGAHRADLSGQVLGGRYRLLRPLGHGGMATIYEAEHVEIGKRVALKVLTDARCSDTVRRFLQEARAASQLRHEHIIDVTDFGRDTLADGEPVAYMAMEYLEGEDLAVTLAQDGPLRWTRVLTIAKQICRALIAAHEQGIVHCDIKPANCYRIARGDTTDYIKVLDFGVASFACKRTGRCTPDPVPSDTSDGRRKSGPRVGTPGYMAGELLSGGTYDHRVDIYALGVLMYRLLTNKMPYPAARLYTAGDSGFGAISGVGGAGPNAGGNSEGSGATALTPFPMQRAIPTLEISPAFESVVLRALAQDPEQRHPSARALLEALVAAEEASLRASPLPRDPLRWGVEVVHPEDSGSLSQTELSRAALSPGASNSDLQRTAPDLSPSGSWQAWRSGGGRRGSGGIGGRVTGRVGAPALVLRAMLALVVSTAVVQAAWNLMS